MRCHFRIFFLINPSDHTNAKSVVKHSRTHMYSTVIIWSTPVKRNTSRLTAIKNSFASFFIFVYLSSSCSTCGKRFTKSHHLKAHLNIHDKNKGNKSSSSRPIPEARYYTDVMKVITPSVRTTDDEEMHAIEDGDMMQTDGLTVLEADDIDIKEGISMIFEDGTIVQSHWLTFRLERNLKKRFANLWSVFVIRCESFLLYLITFCVH